MAKPNYWDKLLGDDEHAASYMETYGEGPGCPTRHALGGLINDGESVLDVGCGPGWNFDHFAEHSPDVIYGGRDYSERFVRVANERVRGKYGLTVDPFEVGDLREIKELNESWDVVIMQDAVEHTNGYEEPVREALRVARKRVIVTFWHLTEDDDHINDDGDDGYGAWYSRPKWEEFLNSLGHVWHHTQIQYPENRVRDYYVIQKEDQDA
jgi:ubiquinone/menaquinone biosynthesis C-methylase UbiE